MKPLLLSCLLSVLVTLTGCATNPVTGKSQLSLVSSAQEVAIGNQQYVPAQQSQGGVYQVDPGLNAYVQQVGNRIAAVSDSSLPYEFVVLNNSSPNAWALPGGKIAVNRGLLTELDNEAELAAVLGHEIVHAAARHGAQAIGRSMLLQGAVLLTAMSTRDSEYSNYIMGSAALGSQLITQKYGRNAELESDYYGMEYMARAGYDPAAAVTLQEKFVAFSKGQDRSWINGLFASHPPSEQRVLRNRETLKNLNAAGRDWETGDKRYADAIAQVKRAEPAYQAFDQAMSLASKKEFDAARGRLDRAISIEPREARFYGLKAYIDYQDRNYQSALSIYNEALERDAAYYEYYLGRGLTHSKLGNRNLARQDLEQSNRLLPTSIASNELGEIALAAGDTQAAKTYFAEVAQTGGATGQAALTSYTRLDMPDNPSRYLRVSVSRATDGRLGATVTNQSPVPVARATVIFRAVINGRQLQATATTGSLPAGGSQDISAGWRLRSGDVLEQFQAIAATAEAVPAD